MRKTTYMESAHTADDDAAAGGRVAGEQRTAESADDRIRGGGVHRLPRGDRSPRVLARSPDVTALRRQRKEVPSRRRPRLDSSRSTNQSVVTERRTCMAVRKRVSQQRLQDEPALRTSVVARRDAPAASATGCPSTTSRFARGATAPVTSKQEAEKVWEPKFIAEIASGKDPRDAAPAA